MHCRLNSLCKQICDGLINAVLLKCGLFVDKYWSFTSLTFYVVCICSCDFCMISKLVISCSYILESNQGVQTFAAPVRAPGAVVFLL